MKPQLLIGQDNWHLLVTTKIGRGDHNQPVASLTPLGWILHGRKTRTMGRTIDYVSHVTEEAPEDNLEAMVKEYFEMDSLCFVPKSTTDPE